MENKDRRKEMASLAEQRSNVYGLLALIFREEPTAAVMRKMKEPRFQGVLKDMGIELEGGFFDQPEEALLEELAVEYTRLFLGPDRHISPHESVHHQRDDGDWGSLWGKSTVEVKKFIETTGLEYGSAYTGLPDHISVELEFMQALTRRQTQAWQEKDVEGAVNCLKIEKQFIEDHLVRWIPAFCDKVISEAKIPFYSELSKLTKNFIEFEREEIGKYLSEAQEGQS